MSSKTYKPLTRTFVRNDIHPVVLNERETLADYVRRLIRDKDLSYRQVAQRSGGEISHATVSDIINGRITNPSTSTLVALAKGLGVPVEEVFAVARGKDPEGDPNFKNWKFAALFDEAQQLTPEQMTRFEIIMEMARREVQRMIQEQDQQEQQEAPRRARRVPDVTTVINATQEEKKKRA